MGANMFIIYLVLKSTRFLRCVLYPSESLHVFSAVLTRLQVRFNNTLSDVLCEKKNRQRHQYCLIQVICVGCSFGP